MSQPHEQPSNEEQQDFITARMTTGLPASTESLLQGQTASHVDWGEAPAELFADLPESTQATSFTSFYDLGFMSVWLLVYVNKGVLVVISLTRFQDGSGRSNYWGREFFFHSREPVAVR